MVEVIRAFCWNQKFVPKGFSALATGLYTCIKSFKMCLKSYFKEIVLKLATNGQREKAFLLSSKFCPQWIVYPFPGLYTYGETWKIMYIKSDLKAIIFKPATKGQSDKGFLLTSKVCPQGVVCPCSRAIYIYKTIKNVYKIRLLFLNLQRLGKVIRAFCWHQKFVPKGLHAPAPGLYTCIKSLNMCIRSDFEEIILKLATNGQSDKGFRWHQHLSPRGCLPLH